MAERTYSQAEVERLVNEAHLRGSLDAFRVLTGMVASLTERAEEELQR